MPSQESPYENKPKKRKIGDLQGADSHDSSAANVSSLESGGRGGGDQVQGLTVSEWGNLMDTFAPLMDERKVLVERMASTTKRLSEVDRLLKELMGKGCHH